MKLTTSHLNKSKKLLFYKKNLYNGNKFIFLYLNKENAGFISFDISVQIDSSVQGLGYIIIPQFSS